MTQTMREKLALAIKVSAERICYVGRALGNSN